MKVYLTLVLSIGLVFLLGCSDGTIPTATEPLVELKATYVTQRPVLDGRSQESIWEQSHPFYVHVKPADGNGKEFNIEFKAIWWKEWANLGTSWDERAYLGLSISWPDETKNIEKQQWRYSAEQAQWIRTDKQSDWLLMQWLGGSEYNDVWFWDAALTNPLGYAEDEFLLISTIDSTISASLWIDGLNYRNDTSEEQNTWDLNYDDNLTPRDSTDDKPLMAWKEITDSLDLTKPRILSGDPLTSWLFQQDADFIKNTPYATPEEGTVIPGYVLEEPQADPADIMAAGYWSDGMWTVELVRVSSTNNNSDISFSPDDRYFQQPFVIAVGNNSKSPLEAASADKLISRNSVVLSFEYLAPTTK